MLSLVCSGLILTLSQCSSKITTPTSSAESVPQMIVDPPPPDSMEIVAALFTEYCSSCHGANAKVFADRSWNEGSFRHEGNLVVLNMDVDNGDMQLQLTLS